MKPWERELLRESVSALWGAFRSWLKERREKRESDLEVWRDIQRRHVERRDLSKDPRPKP